MFKEGEKIEIIDPNKGKFEAVYFTSYSEGRLIHFIIPDKKYGGLVGKQWVTKKEG